MIQVIHIAHSLHILCSILFRHGTTWGPERGNRGGADPDKEIILQYGELINRVSMGSGDIVDMLTFYSDTGKTGIKLCTSQKLHMLPANDPVFSNT